MLCHPAWCFGPPAILKGFFDRVLMPGVSFTLVDGKARPALTHIRHLAPWLPMGGHATWRCGWATRRAAS